MLTPCPIQPYLALSAASPREEARAAGSPPRRGAEGVPVRRSHAVAARNFSAAGSRGADREARLRSGPGNSSLLLLQTGERSLAEDARRVGMPRRRNHSDRRKAFRPSEISRECQGVGMPRPEERQRRGPTLGPSELCAAPDGDRRRRSGPDLSPGRGIPSGSKPFARQPQPQPEPPNGGISTG